MALEGTLRDFSLADIFQLIGIQKKTGILTLNDRRETVTVSFLAGEVVSADSDRKNLEDRLGTVLVKSGRITQDQLRRALATQRETNQRLGFIVVRQGLVREADLRDAIALQITQIVYRLFRWKDGDYHFAQRDSVEFDRDYFTPISAESILMEGIRMIDEWPIIERRIKSFDLVVAKTDPGLRPTIAPAEHRIENDLESTLRGGAAEPPGEGSQAELRVAPDEAEIYDLVDGRRSIQEIIDRGRLGEFETCRILHDLLNRGAVTIMGDAVPSREKLRSAPAVTRWIPAALERASYAALLVVCAASLLTPSRGAFSGSPALLVPSGSLARVEDLVTRNRVERLDEAVRVYFLQKGFLPDDLRELVRGGLISRTSLADPRGNSFGFEATTDGYRIVTYDEGGEVNPRRSLARTLARPSDPAAQAGPLPGAPEARLAPR